MTYFAPFHRLVASGPLYDAERWSFSVNMIDEADGANYFSPDTVPAGIVTAVQTLLTAAGVSGMAKLDSIKFNAIGIEGKYVRSDTVEHVFDPPTANSRTATAILPQQALAVTLLTDVARGLAHSGRFFLPVPTYSVGTDGRISVANATTVANAAAAFVNSLNSAVTGSRVGVVSKVGTGVERPVTGVRVGRVYDTIRSRRTSLDEAYVLATTTIAA